MGCVRRLSQISNKRWKAQGKEKKNGQIRTSKDGRWKK
jgi:hypothetical protein